MNKGVHKKYQYERMYQYAAKNVKWLKMFVYRVLYNYAILRDKIWREHHEV